MNVYEKMDRMISGFRPSFFCKYILFLRLNYHFLAFYVTLYLSKGLVQTLPFDDREK